MKKRTLKEELVYLFSMELLSAVMFLVAYFLFTRTDSRFSYDNAVVFYPLLLLCLILAEGSFYWLNRYLRVVRKKSLGTEYMIPIYQALKIADYCLLAGYVPVFIMNFDKNILKTIFGIFLCLFSILELVNYFHYRISYYSKTGLSLAVIKPLKQLLQGKAVKSQLRKEMDEFRQR